VKNLCYLRSDIKHRHGHDFFCLSLMMVFEKSCYGHLYKPNVSQGSLIPLHMSCLSKNKMNGKWILVLVSRENILFINPLKLMYKSILTIFFFSQGNGGV